MTVSIQLDLEHIYDKIFAHSAADILAHGVERPPVFTKAQRPLLRSLTFDACAAIIFSLYPMVTYADSLASDPKRFVRMGINIPADASPLLYADRIESLIACCVLRAVWGGTDTPLAEKYFAAVDSSLGVLRQGMVRSDRPGRIRPSA